MEKPLRHFSAFILKNTDKYGALEFAKKTLGIKESNIGIFETVSINHIRQIKNKIDINTENEHAFLFGKILYDAQNAALKIIEEPRINTFFIFYKMDNLLDTIISRSQIFDLKRNSFLYTEEANIFLDGNIMDAIKTIEKIKNKEKDDIILFCNALVLKLSSNDNIEKAYLVSNEMELLKKSNLNKRLFLYNILIKLSDKT